MKLTNKFNLPQPVVRAVTRDPYSKGDSDFSVTELIDSPRIRTLRWKHDNEIEEDVSERLFSLMGQAVHHVLERGAKGEGECPEERLFLPLVVDGIDITVSGSMDLQEVGHNASEISDYKVTTVYSFQSEKSSWVQQLNLYAELVRICKNREVSGLRVVAFLRDWQSSKAKTDPNYPPAPMQIMHIPLWPSDIAHAFLMSRAQLHVRSWLAEMSGDPVLPCTDEERWFSKPTFAALKTPGGRASRVFDNAAEALEYASSRKLLVEERKSEPKRCAGNWCKVSQFCDQYNEEKKSYSQSLAAANAAAEGDPGQAGEDQ